MRTKDEILHSMTRQLSTIEGIEGKKHMEWITLIEGLLDIRDILYSMMDSDELEDFKRRDQH